DVAALLQHLQHPKDFALGVADRRRDAGHRQRRMRARQQFQDVEALVEGGRAILGWLVGHDRPRSRWIPGATLPSFGIGEPSQADSALARHLGAASCIGEAGFYIYNATNHKLVSVPR